MLGGLLEEEGLVGEAYKRDVMDELAKLRSGLEAAIEVAPLLKSVLEDYRSREGGAPRRRRGSFLSGALAGVGVSGLVASAFYFGTLLGKAGFVASLILVGVAALASRE